MIVCVCKGVSDREISAAVHAGAETVEEVAASCGAGTCCGSCRPAVSMIVASCRGQDAGDCTGCAAADPKPRSTWSPYEIRAA